MLLRVRSIAFEQIIGPDRDRDLFALIDFDDRQAFDLHHANTLLNLIRYGFGVCDTKEKGLPYGSADSPRPPVRGRFRGRIPDLQTLNSLKGELFRPFRASFIHILASVVRLSPLMRDLVLSFSACGRSRRQLARR